MLHGKYFGPSAIEQAARYSLFYIGLLAYGDESPSDSEEPTTSLTSSGKNIVRPDVRAFTANSIFLVSLLCSRSVLVLARIIR